MNQASVEERVREFIAAERAQVKVPPLMAPRILRLVESSHPAPQRRWGGLLKVASATAAVLLVGLGIAGLRTLQSPAGVVSGTWISGPSMATPRAYHTATLLANGEVLVVGGRGPITIPAPWERASGTAIASAELYDPRTGVWRPARDPNMPRVGHTATLLTNGKVLVVGGSSTVSTASLPAPALASAELFDPQTNSWSPAGSMHTPRAYQSATLLADGRVLVVGGIDSTADDPGDVLASAELYDPVTNAWTLAGAMPSGRAYHAAVLLQDRLVLVLGGTDRTYSPLVASAPFNPVNTTALFDPATDSWTPAPSMKYARIAAAVSLLPDGRVLVVGDSGVNYKTAELFTPGEGWSLAPPPGIGRAASETAQLKDGNVLIAGGLTDTSAQLFDWRRNRWISAGDLSGVRSGGTATLLGNGRVLVTGGFGVTATPWASAEVYDPVGRHAVTTPQRTKTTSPLVPVGPIIATALLLLGFAIWAVYTRSRSTFRPGDGWIGSD